SFAADASSCAPLCTKIPRAISVTGSAAVCARDAAVPSAKVTARATSHIKIATSGCIDVVRASRRARRALLSMRSQVNGSKKTRSPEEAAQRLSRRAHSANPAAPEFSQGRVERDLLVVLPRRRGVARRARPGGAGFVILVVDGLVSFVAYRLALLVHRLPLVLCLERAGVRRSHACRRTRRRARNYALSRARAVLVRLGMDLSGEQQRCRQCQGLTNHAISPGNVV